MFNIKKHIKMKKIITILAIVASATLCTAAIAYAVEGASGTAKGIVHFESTGMPALNFTMPVSRAADIYRLLPESVTSVCCQEYEVVRDKCSRSARFTYEGVQIQCAGTGQALIFVFSVPGYRLTVADVSWETLDALFNADSK